MVRFHLKKIKQPYLIDRDHLLDSIYKTKFKHIYVFNDIYGRPYHPHVKLPVREKKSSNDKKRSLRRKREYMIAVLNYLCRDSKGDEVDDLKAELITSLLKTSEKAQKVAAKFLHSKISPMDIDTEMEILSSMRIFNPRSAIRKNWKELNLNSTLSCGKLVYDDDEYTRTVHYAYISNVEEVLSNYVHILSEKFDIAITGGALWMRLAVDKAKEFSKVTISFANMEKNQSRYCQLVVGALVGQDNARNLRVFDELFKTIENIKHIRFNGTSTAVQLFIIGDNKGLSALKGHAGHASRNLCLLCPILNISLRKWETFSLVALPLRSYALDEPGIKEEPLIQTSAREFLTDYIN